MGPDSCDEKVNELIEACFRGSFEQVQALLSLSDHPDVNGCSEDENTPLQAAASSGNEKLVELLLDAGAQEDIDCCNAFGWTAVMHAAYHGHLKVLNILVARNANINKKSYYRVTPLTLAARGGHTSVVEALLKWGAMIDPPAGEITSLTPLMAASMRSQNHICANLINLGANTNAFVGGPGVSVLMMAAIMADISTVQLLLVSGADANMTTCRGHTAMHLAAAKRRKDIHTFLESKTAAKTSHGYIGSNIGIFDAIKSKNHRRVRECLQEDPQSANLVGAGGETPLMLACMYGRMDFVTMLISNNANIDATDANGRTPLIHAIAHGKTGTAKYLIHAGADVDTKAIDGSSALDMAAVGLTRVGRSTGLGTRTPITPIPRVTIAPDDQIFVDKSRLILDQETELFESLEEIVGTPSELLASSSHLSINQPQKASRLVAHIKVDLGTAYDMVYSNANRRPSENAVPLLDLSSLHTSRLANRRSSGIPDLGAFTSFRSPAFLNALSMGPGRPTPIEPMAPPLKCAKNKPTPISSSRESSLPHSRTHSALVSPSEIAGELSSSQSSAGNGGSLNRRRRQYAMSNTGALGTGMTHLGVMRRRAATGGQQSFPRPHSYHLDPAAQPPGILRYILNSSMAPSGRPHSYHDADSGLGSRGVSLTRGKHAAHLSARDAASESELPVTPTRKSFAFNFSAANLNKHDSLPQLQQSDSAASSLNASEFISAQTSYAYATQQIKNENYPKINLGQADVRQVLRNLSLLEFVDVLEQNEVDMETLVTLTEGDLFELGLTDPFSRGKLMAGINIIASCQNTAL